MSGIPSVLALATLEKSLDHSVGLKIVQGNLLDILREMGIERNDRKIDSPYVGNGKVHFKRTNDKLEVSINVGCCCERDCCGHLSSLNYSFQKLAFGNAWAVCIAKSYNY